MSYALQIAPPLAADGPALTHVLQRAGVTKDDLVRVTGPAGLTAVLWLARKGYRRAVYAPALGAVAHHEPADAVLIPSACLRHDLVRLIKGPVGLRAGGALIFQSWSQHAGDDPDGITGPLGACGYKVEHTLLDKGRAVYIARRQDMGGYEQAA